MQNSVEILQLLDKVDMPVVVTSGADGQTAQKTVEIPQSQFFGPDCEKTIEIPQFFSRCSFSACAFFFVPGHPGRFFSPR